MDVEAEIPKESLDDSDDDEIGYSEDSE